MAATTPLPGKSFVARTADGRRLAGRVAGQGEPLVLLEVGLGAPSASWASVAEGIARFARAAFYDRAGRGDSDPAPKPRGPADLVQDVRSVVAALSPQLPVVFVGQSLGGLIGRLYAHEYPREIGALVLVDSLHEDQFERCGAHFPAVDAGEPAALASMRSFWSSGWKEPQRNPEGIDLPACRAAAHAIATLGSLPLRVLTASGFTSPAAGFGPAGARLQSIWDELQEELSSLSSDSSRQVLADTGHFVQIERPEAVVDAVREIVDRLRGALAQPSLR